MVKDTEQNQKRKGNLNLKAPNSPASSSKELFSLFFFINIYCTFICLTFLSRIKGVVISFSFFLVIGVARSYCTTAVLQKDKINQAVVYQFFLVLVKAYRIVTFADAYISPIPCNFFFFCKIYHVNLIRVILGTHFS